MYRLAKNTGIAETNRARDIAAMKEAIEAINHTLNNGGLVRELKTLQLNCGSSMMAVQKGLEAHEKLPGHADLPQKVAEIEGRLGSLENSRKSSQNDHIPTRVGSLEDSRRDHHG
jgi:hypothetical protein